MRKAVTRLQLIAAFSGMCAVSLACAADPAEISKAHITAGTVGYRTVEEALKKAGLLKYLTPENDQVRSKAVDNTQALIEELGEHYAGTWIEYDEHNSAHQMVAVAADGIHSKTLQDDPTIGVLRVRYSLKEMMAVHERLLYEYVVDSSAPVRLTFASVALQKNMIAVHVNPGDVDKARGMLAKAGFDMDMFYFQEARAPVPLAGPVHREEPSSLDGKR